MLKKHSHSVVAMLGFESQFESPSPFEVRSKKQMLQEPDEAQKFGKQIFAETKGSFQEIAEPPDSLALREQDSQKLAVQKISATLFKEQDPLFVYNFKSNREPLSHSDTEFRVLAPQRWEKLNRVLIQVQQVFQVAYAESELSFNKVLQRDLLMANLDLSA